MDRGESRQRHACATRTARLRCAVDRLKESDLATPGTGFKMGVPPRRIDILTQIDGVAFEAAWPRRIDAMFADGIQCGAIGLDDLIANKRASGRPQDLADASALERLRAIQRRR